MPFLLPFFMRALHRVRRGFRRPDLSRPRCTQSGRPSRQSGASVIEFPLVAVPLLLVGLGSIEVAHWLLTRQALSLALLQAARAGAADHGRPDTMEAAFDHALLPLFAGSARHNPPQAQAAAFAKRVHDTGLAPWQIQILSPTAAAFDDFADPALMQARHSGLLQGQHRSLLRPGNQGPIQAGHPPLPAINNDYQLEQHRRHAASGWPNGLGPRSKQSIFEANTLVLRLRYLHEPALPGMKRVLRLLGNENGTYGQRAMARGGYLPITREIALTMDSHPLLWPMPASGKFAGSPGQHTATVPGAASCQAWGCPERGGQSPVSSGGPQADKPASGTPTNSPASGGLSNASGPGGGTVDPWPGSPQPAGDANMVDEALAVGPDDPACGVALCCAGS